MAIGKTSAATTDRREHRWRGQILRRLAAVSIMLALVASACGGGSEEASGGSGGSAGGSGQGSSRGGDNDAQKAFLAYARCMREHGINMPDPDPSGNGVLINGGDSTLDRDALAKAESACRHHLAGVTVDTPGGLSDSEMQDRLIKLAQCLRQRGFNVPDPQVAGHGGGAGPLDGEPDFDINDPNFKKAERECTKVAGLPEPGRPQGRGARS